MAEAMGWVRGVCGKVGGFGVRRRNWERVRRRRRGKDVLVRSLAYPVHLCA